MLPDGLWFFLLATSSNFFCAAARNVLFHVLDLRTPFINWFEQFSLFCVFSLLFSLGVLRRDSTLTTNVFYRPVILYFTESALSSVVHSQFRTGQLYLIRIFDFVFTGTLLFVTNEERNEKRSSFSQKHLFLLSVFASISWLEFGQLEYTVSSFIFSPLLSIVKALRVVAIRDTYVKLGRPSTESFLHLYSSLCTAVLLPPALVSLFWRDVQITASWESIDYVLLSLSPLWFATAAFTDGWQITQLPLHAYVVSEHCRMTIGSCGQWIIQNMAHPCIIAFGGKIAFLLTLPKCLLSLRTTVKNSA